MSCQHSRPLTARKVRRETWELTGVSELCPRTSGSTQRSQWFVWKGCRWQISCHIDPKQDTVFLCLKYQPITRAPAEQQQQEHEQQQQQPKRHSSVSLAAYAALRVVNQRQGNDAVRYLPLHSFSSSNPEVTAQNILRLSDLRQQQSPYVVNDRLVVAAELSEEPLTDGLVRSPFGAMFGGDLTRFLSGNAFLDLRLAVIDAGPEDYVDQFPFHTGRLEKVSEVMRARLAPQLKTLPARPVGFGAAQPLMLLDTSLPVLRLFHKLVYEEEVMVPEQLLLGLLDLAVKYDMPVLEQWVQQQAQMSGHELEVAATCGSGHFEVTPDELTNLQNQAACGSSSSGLKNVIALSASARDRKTRTAGGALDKSSSEGGVPPRPVRSAGGAEPVPEPERRSCGKDQFRRVFDVYEEATSTLQQEHSHSCHKTGTYDSWVPGSVPQTTVESCQEPNRGSNAKVDCGSVLSDQMAFWRQQQEKAQRFKRNSRSESAETSAGPSWAGSGSLRWCSTSELDCAPDIRTAAKAGDGRTIHHKSGSSCSVNNASTTVAAAATAKGTLDAKASADRPVMYDNSSTAVAAAGEDLYGLNPLNTLEQMTAKPWILAEGPSALKALLPAASQGLVTSSSATTAAAASQDLESSAAATTAAAASQDLESSSSSATTAASQDLKSSAAAATTTAAGSSRPVSSCKPQGHAATTAAVAAADAAEQQALVAAASQGPLPEVSQGREQTAAAATAAATANVDNGDDTPHSSAASPIADVIATPSVPFVYDAISKVQRMEETVLQRKAAALLDGSTTSSSKTPQVANKTAVSHFSTAAAAARTKADANTTPAVYHALSQVQHMAESMSISEAAAEPTAACLVQTTAARNKAPATTNTTAAAAAAAAASSKSVVLDTLLELQHMASRVLQEAASAAPHGSGRKAERQAKTDLNVPVTAVSDTVSGALTAAGSSSSSIVLKFHYNSSAPLEAMAADTIAGSTVVAAALSKAPPPQAAAAATTATNAPAEVNSLGDVTAAGSSDGDFQHFCTTHAEEVADMASQALQQQVAAAASAPHSSTASAANKICQKYMGSLAHDAALNQEPAEHIAASSSSSSSSILKQAMHQQATDLQPGSADIPESAKSAKTVASPAASADHADSAATAAEPRFIAAAQDSATLGSARLNAKSAEIENAIYDDKSHLIEATAPADNQAAATVAVTQGSNRSCLMDTVSEGNTEEISAMLPLQQQQQQQPSPQIEHQPADSKRPELQQQQQQRKVVGAPRQQQKYATSIRPIITPSPLQQQQSRPTAIAASDGSGAMSFMKRCQKSAHSLDCVQQPPRQHPVFPKKSKPSSTAAAAGGSSTKKAAIVPGKVPQLQLLKGTEPEHTKLQQQQLEAIEAPRPQKYATSIKPIIAQQQQQQQSRPTAAAVSDGSGAVSFEERCHALSCARQQQHPIFPKKSKPSSTAAAGGGSSTKKAAIVPGKAPKQMLKGSQPGCVRPQRQQQQQQATQAAAAAAAATDKHGSPSTMPTEQSNKGLKYARIKKPSRPSDNSGGATVCCWFKTKFVFSC